MGLFIEVILPILSVFFAGYILQKYKKLNVSSVSTVSIYIFMPTLVFKTFYNVDLNQHFYSIISFCIALLFLHIVLIKILRIIFRWNQENESAFILSTAFMNAGNYGSPVVLFAFGEVAFMYAVIIMSIQSMLMNIFGVYYASRGKSSVKQALQSVLRMPATYAIILAITLKQLNIGIPENIYSIIDFLSVVTVPLMMVVLGMQLANISLKSFEVANVATASVIRLIISPLLALFLATLFPVSDLLKSVFILIAAMPSAAVTTMFAVEFKTKPDLVSSITLTTTVLSVVTLSVILSILV